MIKVCQICAVDFTLDKLLSPLVFAMQKEGWAVTCICSDGEAIPSLRQRGLNVTTVKIPRRINVFSLTQALIRLVIILKMQKFDVVHAHTPVAGLIGRLASRIAGVPITVYTAHGFYFHDEMGEIKKSFFIFLERWAGKFTSLLFTQSNEDAHTAVRKKICSVERVKAIGNGVDTSKFDPNRVPAPGIIRASLNIPKNAFVVGMVARLVEEKGVPDFLQAAKLIAASDKSVFFLLVGERLRSDHNKSIFSDLEEARMILGERLILTGLRSDIPELLASMDIFCLPSWREGMPRTIIEAMMMAKPVVATNIRGSREEVIDGVTGILVPTRSPQRLAEALKLLIANRTKASTMGLAGRERALRFYDESKAINLQIENIRELVIAKRLENKLSH